MCNFLSAVFLQNGDVLCEPEATDSHALLLDMAGIKDDRPGQGHFVQVEFSPSSYDTILDLDKWVFRVEDPSPPAWFDATKAEEWLKRRVTRTLVNDTRSRLAGGCWILGPEAKVRLVANARVIAMTGAAHIDELEGSSFVGAMKDSASIDRMYSSSRVLSMLDKSFVGALHNQSSVDMMQDQSRVEVVTDTAIVLSVMDRASIDVIADSGRVDHLGGHSTVRCVQWFGQVKDVMHHARVEEVRAHGVICSVRGQATVGLVKDKGVVLEQTAPAQIKLEDDAIIVRDRR